MAFKLLTIVGARPQFVKAAVLSRLFSKSKNIQEILLHTGQHFDHQMSQVFFDQLDIPQPHYDLAIHGGPHGEMTGRMLEGIEKVLLKEKVDALLVYGDTNSTLAGALAAIKHQIPILHVEAGLRSYNRKMPEEINRVLTDHISTLLFCPTKAAISNLEKEGIQSGTYLVGDVMHDATIYAKQKSYIYSSIIEELNLNNKKFGLITIHRAENTDDKNLLTEILDYIYALKKEMGDIHLIFPLHPRTKAVIEKYNLKIENIQVCDPLSYMDTHQLLSKCELVLTDSGGLQKEAYFHRVPCITLRNETEWIETIDAGWNMLWKSRSFPNKIQRQEISDYGNGNSGEKILNIINQHFGL